MPNDVVANRCLILWDAGKAVAIPKLSDICVTVFTYHLPSCQPTYCHTYMLYILQTLSLANWSAKQIGEHFSLTIKAILSVDSLSLILIINRTIIIVGVLKVLAIESKIANPPN